MLSIPATVCTRPGGTARASRAPGRTATTTTLWGRISIVRGRTMAGAIPTREARDILTITTGPTSATAPAMAMAGRSTPATTRAMGGRTSPTRTSTIATGAPTAPFSAASDTTVRVAAGSTAGQPAVDPLASVRPVGRRQLPRR